MEAEGCGGAARAAKVYQRASAAAGVSAGFYAAYWQAGALQDERAFPVLSREPVSADHRSRVLRHAREGKLRLLRAGQPDGEGGHRRLPAQADELPASHSHL